MNKKERDPVPGKGVRNVLNLGILQNEAAQVILTLAVMLLAGFLMTRITKKLKLPNVTGYILAGILIGPYLLDVVPHGLIPKMDFVTDMALAFIAFGVGRYFKISNLRATGWSVLGLTLCEALAASVVVTLAMLLFGLPLPFCLLLGAIASATAPASTLMTIRQYRAKGPFVNTILQVVALDDAVSLVAFSVCSAAATALDGSGLRTSELLLPLLWNLLALLVGSGCGWVLHKLIDGNRSDDHRLILAVAVLLAITGLCTALNVSPLLSCMAVGTVYINVGGDKQMFERISSATPPVLLLFFMLSGIRLELPMLATAGVIGLAYFFARIVGKYAGAWVGARLTGAPEVTRKYLGLALIPQAGVSIGLAALGQRILPAEMGALLSTIILSSGVLYEMVGPACAKLSLTLSGTLEGGCGHNAHVPGNKTLPRPNDNVA